MDFGIKRLALSPSGAPYHLFDGRHRLIMVADQGTPWLTGDPSQHVRFARPDGKPIAALDRPWTEKTRNRRDVRHAAHALIRNHAVYAIFNQYLRLGPDQRPLTLPYYVIEVEEVRWLALGAAAGQPYYTLYDHVPATLNQLELPTPAQLPHPIGAITARTAVESPYDFTIELSGGRLRQTGLVALALVYLLEKARPDDPIA